MFKNVKLLATVFKVEQLGTRGVKLRAWTLYKCTWESRIPWSKIE